MTKINAQHKTWQIHIEGLVQGVGFRPFVYQLAIQLNLTGWVNNTTHGVHVKFTGDAVTAKKFYKMLINQAPVLSIITHHFFAEINFKTFQSFEIIDSQTTEAANLVLTPDFGMCQDCKAELNTDENRRSQYPFITCTQCGPRYSIITQVPYDRENTTMKIFEMCPQCNKEYHDPTNRRHFSQTNSCPECAIIMQLFDSKENLIENTQSKIITKICALWNAGKIVAIKGIGGYLLTCDAGNEAAIKELRKRKHRHAKPFALIFPDINSLQKEVHLHEKEIKELKSVHAPIVLLNLKNQASSKLALKEIAPGLSCIGVMLPYTPLYVLLMEHFKKPIIATSGNISNAPIIFRDADALENLVAIADYILINNREIITPQDDSLITYSRQTQQRIMLRHARGFAPWYINDKIVLPDITILATGAMLKSSFTLLHSHNIHVSQYLGNTDNVDAQNNFEHTLNHFLHLFKCRPKIILADKHPDYFSSQFAERLSKEWNIPLIKVQHHEAHFCAVMAENNLLDEEERVLGVIWDGTGLGDDRQIWGGEFFLFHEKQFTRINHVEYFNWIVGDKMAREPRLSALSLCYDNKESEKILRPKFSTIEWNNYHQLLSNNQLKTSSMGRVFDAVASLLGVTDISSFEGEAAMMVSELALNYLKKNPQLPTAWLRDNELQNNLNPKLIIDQIINAVNQGTDKSEIAAWFHVRLALMIKKVANENHCNKVCCSGGVFQNEVLIDLLAAISGENITLYYNKDLPPNDENISFGQLAWFIMYQKNFSSSAL